MHLPNISVHVGSRYGKAVPHDGELSVPTDNEKREAGPRRISSLATFPPVVVDYFARPFQGTRSARDSSLSLDIVLFVLFVLFVQAVGSRESFGIVGGKARKRRQVFRETLPALEGANYVAPRWKPAGTFSSPASFSVASCYSSRCRDSRAVA